MKNIHQKIILLLPVLIAISFVSCKKDNTEGTPVITKVRTVYKSAVDSSAIYTITYRDSAGVTLVDSVKTMNGTPQVSNFDSIVVSGNLQNMYAIIGQNLSNATQVLFNGTPAYFNRALSSATTILVTIPQITPSGPNQKNVLTVVTTHGTATFKFIVNAPPPTITSVSDYNFYGGSKITLSGIGFGSVTHVALTGVSDTCTIVSNADTVIALQFPTTSANRANLILTYSSGSVTSTQEFVDLDNAYQIFANNNFQNSWQDASWSGPSGLSTAASHSGTASALVTYPAGGWKIEGWANWYPSFTYSADYKFLTFWVKGGSVDHTLVLVGDQMAGGYSQNTSPAAIQNILVPHGVWTYYKIPLGPPSSSNAGLLNFWANGTTAKQLGFFLKGQTGDVDETMYFDEIAFVK